MKAFEILFGSVGAIAFFWALSVYGPQLEMKLRESRANWRFWSMDDQKQGRVLTWIIALVFFLFLLALDAARRALF